MFGLEAFPKSFPWRFTFHRHFQVSVDPETLGFQTVGFSKKISFKHQLTQWSMQLTYLFLPTPMEFRHVSTLIHQRDPDPMRPGKRSSAATGCAEDPGIGGAVATSLQTAEARSKPWRFGLCQTHLWEISGLIYPWIMVNLSMKFMMDTRWWNALLFRNWILILLWLPWWAEGFWGCLLKGVATAVSSWDEHTVSLLPVQLQNPTRPLNPELQIQRTCIDMYRKSSKALYFFHSFHMFPLYRKRW